MTAALVNSWDTDDRRALRDLTRQFTTEHVLPDLTTWERNGEVPRELHHTAATLGLLEASTPESVSGSGGNTLDMLAIREEIIRSPSSSKVSDCRWHFRPSQPPVDA